MALTGEHLRSDLYNYLFYQLSNLGLGEKYTHVLNSIILLVGMAILLFIVDFLLRRIVRILILKLVRKSKTRFDDYLIRNSVLQNITHFIPLVIAKEAFPLIFAGFPKWTGAILSVADVIIVLTFAMIVNGIVKSFRDYFKTKKAFADKPLDSYSQVVSIFIYSVAGVVIFSNLTGKSPVSFLISLGAASAVLMLVFKDTILGFVASIQVSANDMVRVGDWVQMQKYEADGHVLSINLNTVKIQNWDRTITTVPTYAFISDSFKNWRGMTESGSRQIKRSIHFKMSSFKFCDDADLEKFKKYRLIRDYILKKEHEIADHNAKIADEAMISVNIRRLTNIGVFRVYAEHYLMANPQINKKLITTVRQLSPTPKGLPLEVYCFTYKTDLIHYEKVAADIFDHLLTVAHEFGLEIFEEPSGADFTRAFSEDKKY